MELQIQDLVSSIKKEGIDAGKKEADKIISEAKKKAEEIVEKAKADAEKIFEESEKEIEILRQGASVSAKQAQRDAVISFKAEIEAQFKRILKDNVKKILKSDDLAKLIAACLSDEDVSKYRLELASVSDAVKSQLAEEIKKGLEIKLVKDSDCGFRLATKDGSGYFDCSDEEIGEMLAPFFSEITL